MVNCPGKIAVAIDHLPSETLLRPRLSVFVCSLNSEECTLCEPDGLLTMQPCRPGQASLRYLSLARYVPDPFFAVHEAYTALENND